MSCTTSLYPWEAPALVAETDAETAQLHRDEHDAWLDAFLADAYESWLDDVAEDDEPAYVPFQLDASEYADCVGNVTAEPGYLESTAPYLF